MQYTATHHRVMGVSITAHHTLEGVITEYAVYGRIRWANDPRPIVEYTRDGGLMLAIFFYNAARDSGVWDVIYHDRALDPAAPLDALRRVDEHLEGLERTLDAALAVPPSNPTADVLALALSIPRGMPRRNGGAR